MNSSIEIAEAVKLAEKLIARTREGKLAWEPDGILQMIGVNTDMSQATNFATALEDNLKATVYLKGSGQELAFSLVEVEPKSHTPKSLLAASSTKDILNVSVEKDPSYGYDTVDEKQLAGLLLDLYGLARRAALKLDVSLQRALTYLDKLAV